MSGFDEDRAWLRGPDLFPRFRPEGAGTPIREAELKDDLELIIAARGGEKVALLMRELSYPHVAQGALAGEPYLVSF